MSKLRVAKAKQVDDQVKSRLGLPLGLIVALIKDHTGSGTWGDEGISASTMGEWIVVKQYAEVHEEIGRLLALLRSAR